MNWIKQFPRLIIVVLLFTLVSCNSGMSPSTATSTFTQLPEYTQFPPTLQATLTPTRSPALNATNTPPGLLFTSIVPTKEFSGKNSFGDGFIAHIPIDTSPTDQEEIVNILVTQWLEHYKTENTQPNMMIKEYKIEDVTLGNKTPDNPYITAGVQFSVIPAETSSSASEIPKTIWYGSALAGIDGNWWRFALAFNVYEKDHLYYWLRIVSFGG